MKNKYRILILAPLLFALLAPSNVEAAVDMFLKISGPDVEGESQDSVHQNEIDVLAWSWGMSYSGTTHVGSGGGDGKANFQDLSLTKYLDKSTPALMTAISNGNHFDSIVLTVRKAGAEPLEYYIITMTDVIVTSLSTGGSGGEDRLTENVSFNFAKVQVKYVTQNSKGLPGSSVDFKYDIAAQTSF